MEPAYIIADPNEAGLSDHEGVGSLGIAGLRRTIAVVLRTNDIIGGAGNRRQSISVIGTKDEPLSMSTAEGLARTFKG